jgi:hypothetical protein
VAVTLAEIARDRLERLKITQKALTEAAQERRTLALCLAELAKLSRNVATYRSAGHIDTMAKFLDSYGAVFTAADAFMCEEQKIARARWEENRARRLQERTDKENARVNKAAEVRKRRADAKAEKFSVWFKRMQG